MLACHNILNSFLDYISTEQELDIDIQRYLNKHDKYKLNCK